MVLGMSSIHFFYLHKIFMDFVLGGEGNTLLPNFEANKNACKHIARLTDSSEERPGEKVFWHRWDVFQPQISGFYAYHRLYGKFLLFWALQLSTISFTCICLVHFPSPKILLVARRHERLLQKLASLAV